MTQNDQPTWNPVMPAPARPAEGVAYAGFWIRLLAWILDGVAIGILVSILSPLAGGSVVVLDGHGFVVNSGSGAVGALTGLVYFVGLWAWRGQTIGMMPFRLWVVDADTGSRPDLLRAFLRYVGLIISFVVILLGVIWVAFDGRKQGWHDKLANTLVIRR